jgi:hypothetical protein
MPTEAPSENYLELFDVTKKEQVGKLPLALLRFLPRVGERIFFPFSGPGNWISYTVVAVEYFIGYNPSTGEAATPSTSGTGKITLFVQPNQT